MNHGTNKFERRPWGTFEVLDESRSVENSALHQVKRLVVNPGEQLSLQKHKFRAEHWYVVSGAGEAIVGTTKVKLSPGTSVDIAQLEMHRARCDADSPTPLVLIEVQTGTYLGEDDIERFEDEYGRCK